MNVDDKNKDIDFENLQPWNVAESVFRRFDGSVVCGVQKTSKGDGKAVRGLATQFKAAADEVKRIMSEYCQEVDYTMDTDFAQLWSSNEFREGKNLRLHCCRCERMGKYSLIVAGTCVKLDERCGIKVRFVFFHNLDCCKPIASNVALKKKEPTRPVVKIVKFNYDEIIGNTYDTCVQQCRAYDSEKDECPPGKHINLGNANYPHDNRVYELLPSEKYGGLCEVAHRKCMTAFFYHFASSQNLADEMAPYVFDLESSLAKTSGPGEKRKFKSTGFEFKKNPNWHIRFAEISLLCGGHHKGDSPEPIHQICHKDGETGGDHVISKNEALFGLCIPGSFILPTDTTRTIYVVHPQNRYVVEKGEYILFSGNVAHGGITWVVQEGQGKLEWQTAIHGHYDTTHHERKQGFLNMEDIDDLCFLPKGHLPYFLRETRVGYFQKIVTEMSDMIKHSTEATGEKGESKEMIDIAKKMLSGAGWKLEKKQSPNKKQKRS